MANLTERFDATHDWAGKRVRALILRDFPLYANILDVGPCWGKYRDLLPEYDNVDAVEIWQPYVDEEKLHEKYRKVIVGDIYLVIEKLENYEVVIMGDVLEHIPVDHAQKVIQKLTKKSEVIVVVPYLYPQEAEDNPHQFHEQDDLTPELMYERYPELKLIAVETKEGEPFKGLYRRA